MLEPRDPVSSPASIPRIAFGAATVLTALLGLTGDRRWFAASGAFGTLWWLWDVLWENVIAPFGTWLDSLLTGTASVSGPPDLSVDDTIRMLEARLRGDGVPRHVQIQSAMRLEELYRLGRKDPAMAAEVIRLARARWPDAPELARYERGEAGS